MHYVEIPYNPHNVLTCTFDGLTPLAQSFVPCVYGLAFDPIVFGVWSILYTWSILFILFYIFIMTLTLTYVSLISPDMEDRLPYLGITFSSFVEIYPYLTKL